MRAAGAAKHPHASLILFRSHPSPVLTQHPHFNHGSRFSPPTPMAQGLFLNYSCVPVGNHISSHCGEYRLPTRKMRTSDAPRYQVRVACSGGSCHGRLRRNHASHIKIRPCVYYIPPWFFFSPSFLSYSHLFATLN